MKSNAARNVNIDLVKCLAAFCVVSVHFYAYIGFYQEPLIGSRMFILNGMRTAFMICVPLFLITTGYLMQKKKLEGKYYKGIVRTLSVYVLISIACIVYRHVADAPPYSLAQGVAGIFAFNVTEYAWYIEMYVGLFLLIPFLNMIYQNLPSQKAKLMLVATVGLLTVGPSIFNLWINIVPDWWLASWPLVYYFLGCYLREFPLKVKKNVVLLLAFFVWVLACATWNYFHAQTMPGGLVDTGDLYWWSSIQNVVSSVLIFSWIQNLNLSRLPVLAKSLIVRLSGLSLGLYLCSYIFDKVLYPLFLAGTDWAGARLELFVVIVPLVFVCSAIFSQIIDWIYEALCWIGARIREKCSRGNELS